MSYTCTITYNRVMLCKALFELGIVTVVFRVDPGVMLLSDSQRVAYNDQRYIIVRMQ